MERIGLNTLRLVPSAGAPAPAPADPFPAALLAASGDYVHFAAEDAGAFWTARHGTPLTMDRFGSPVLVTHEGVPFLDCAAGAYDVLQTTPFPQYAPFSLWALTGGNRPPGIDFYIGPAAYTNNARVLQFRSNSTVDVGNYKYRTTWDIPAANGAESVEWERPAGTTDVYDLKFYHNGVERIVTEQGTARGFQTNGGTIVIGGTRDAAGVTVPGGTKVRDVVLTIGWTLDATQRAALEAYRLARLTP